jgi:hypothetical protein
MGQWEGKMEVNMHGGAARAWVVGVAACVFAVASPGHAAILVDDFNYPNTDAFKAVWGNGNEPEIDHGFGNAPPSLIVQGGPANQRGFTGTNPTDAAPLIWEFDLYDPGDLGILRITGALRDVGGSAPGNQAFFEMGRYSDLYDPETNTSGHNGYGIRSVFVGGPTESGGWLTFAGDSAILTAWHHMKATIGDTYALFELDLEDDGTIDASRSLAINAADKVYNLARFGGPSDVAPHPSEFGTVVAIDNLSIEQVPGSSPPGDYNHDGFINAADYVLWRKSDGSPEGYNEWRANFGSTSGGGSFSTVVPEPAVGSLLAIAVVLSALVRGPRLGVERYRGITAAARRFFQRSSISGACS